MTTSQASRLYNIPYNSLLMYVRGKYGKSLKLDDLKSMTPAAFDCLNTIGNSRSTPKEKLLARAQKLSPKKGEKKAAGLPTERFGRRASATGECGRIKDLIMEMHNQQAILNHNERLKELEKRLPSDQAKILLPFLEMSGMPVSPPAESSEGSPAQASLGSPMQEDEEIEVEKQDPIEDKERQVREILIEAATNRKRDNSAGEESEGSANGKADEEKDDEALGDEEIPKLIRKPIEVKVPKPDSEMSSLL